MMRRGALAEVLTIIDTEAASLRYYPATRIVHHEIRRFIHGPQLRALLLEGVRAFRKYGANKWLSDDRGNGPLKPEDAAWASAEWSPQVMAAGWKYWALVAGVIAVPFSTSIGAFVLCRWMPGPPRRVAGMTSALRFALATYGNFTAGYSHPHSGAGRPALGMLARLDSGPPCRRIRVRKCGSDSPKSLTAGQIPASPGNCHRA